MTRRRAGPQGCELLLVEAEGLRCARLGVWESEGGGLGPRRSGERSPCPEGLGQDRERLDASLRITGERVSWALEAAAVSAFVTEKRATA